MNPGFDEILRTEAQTWSGLFTTTAQRLGTTPQNVEKDFPGRISSGASSQGWEAPSALIVRPISFPRPARLMRGR